MEFISIYFWQWWILAGILILMGFVMPGTFLLWIGFAAAVTGLIIWPFASMHVGIQLFIFAILAVIGILLWSKKFKNKSRHRRK